MRARSERGAALISALLVLMLMSAMLAGFLALVNADQAAGGITRDQTQAYAAAHAGLEKLTADLGSLFVGGNYAPAQSDLDDLMADPPHIDGFEFLSPNDQPGYVVEAQPVNWRSIANGPYQGLTGLITPYEITVTARSSGGAEVRTRRELQTVGIPVFQFGIFSENNLSFFAGPNFNFGGRVHTNQNLFLKQDGDAILTLADRVTAVGEVIRTHLANGQTTHGGCVRVTTEPGSDRWRFLGRNKPPSTATTCAGSAACSGAGCEGSLVGNLGSAVNPAFEALSTGVYNRNIMNGRTGARRLDLPLVSDGATPVDIIRRPPVDEDETTPLARQRFFHLATLRILLSDTAADITGLPSVVSTPERLAGIVDPTAWGTNSMTGVIPAATPFAVSRGRADLGDRTTENTPRIDGWFSAEMQRRNGEWVDVTREILSLGFVGRRLSNGTILVADENSGCPNPHPDAVIRLQRTRDDRTNPGAGFTCGHDNTTKLLPFARDYWPNVLYDAREGAKRDSVNQSQVQVWWSGVMHYVELDVLNLKRWLAGDIGSSGSATCANGTGDDTCPMDVTGFVVYFSDRRTNRNLGGDGTRETTYTVADGWTYSNDGETGELGWEDNINPTSSTSDPNGTLDGAYVDADGNDRYAEDLNLNDQVDTYGNEPRLLPTGAATDPGKMLDPVTSCPTPAGNNYNLWNTPVDADVARVNRAFFFRRALKLVNGGEGNLPANGTQGLTVAAENPVYVQGNYNACSNITPTSSNSWEPDQTACAATTGPNRGFGPAPGVDHVSAAVIADAVTLLSNRWNDIKSFDMPFDVDYNTSPNNGSATSRRRQAATTWYRLAVIAGKHNNFTRPTNNTGDHTDFGTDGGAHNFLRYLERWDGETLNYRGSIISFYTSRQGVGLYKCCNNVYTAPTRGYNFDTEFLTPTLLPPRTPMFRDINTLTFRQILRPTQ